MRVPKHERKAQLATSDGQLRELRRKYPDRRIYHHPGTGLWGAGPLAALPEVTASSAAELDRKLAAQ